jgi:hypothetical protein
MNEAIPGITEPTPISAASEIPVADQAMAGFEWSIVEIMGHRMHAGRTREEEKFGSKMLRIDVPIKGDPANGWQTHYYSGSSLFSYRLTDEATVMKMNKPYDAPSRYALPAPDEDHDDDGFGD